MEETIVLTDLEKEILIHTLGIGKGVERNFYALTPYDKESKEWKSLKHLENLDLMYSFPASINPQEIVFCCTEKGIKIAAEIYTKG